MTDQPNDVSHCTYDANRFSNLDTYLSFRGDSQTVITKPDMNSSNCSPLESSDLLPENVLNELIDEFFDPCATITTLSPSYLPHEQSLADCQFDEFQLLYLLDGPINEVTVTTTPSDVEEHNNSDTINSTPLESNSNESEILILNEIENSLKQGYNQICLQTIDSSIHQRTMSVKVQPPANIRPRYKSEGTRQIEKARTKPMTIKLPDLRDIQLDPDQSFLLRLALITHSKNPLDQVYIHANRLEYHSDGVQELQDGSVCTLVTPDEINKGEKALLRPSIINTTFDIYKPELTPYRLSGIEEKFHENINENGKMPMSEARVIFKKFNLKASQIACQLLIQQNDTLYFTDITCQTHVLEEKEKPDTTKKRKTDSLGSDDKESQDERPSSSEPKSVKRKKRSDC